MRASRIAAVAGFAFLIVLVGSILLPASAVAAMRDGSTSGLDPLSALEHVLVALAVGIWAAQIGRTAVWLLPLTFALLVASGAVLGVAGLPLPGAEDGMALSLAVLGVLVAVTVRHVPAIAAGLVALFGLLHGHAQGLMMPDDAAPLPYLLGLVTVTLVLALLGLGIGLSARIAAARPPGAQAQT